LVVVEPADSIPVLVLQQTVVILFLQPLPQQAVVVVHLSTLPPQAVALAVVLVMALVLLLALDRQIKATLAGQMFLMSPVVGAEQVVLGRSAQAPEPTTEVMVAQGFLLT
jgi:hypothetical protein